MNLLKIDINYQNLEKSSVHLHQKNVILENQASVLKQENEFLKMNNQQLIQKVESQKKIIIELNKVNIYF